jgi:alkylation response protein AidB-like acyl-CoA dehydrogenase
MVTASGHIAARKSQRQNESDHVARATRLATVFAERAPLHDRDGSFPFQNFDDLSKAGLLALTVPAALGGGGAGAAEAARILGIIGKADPSTALVLSMHYIQHLVMARSSRWPTRLSRRLARETVDGVALVNALRVEPELGSPARGGLPATIARRTETGWRLSGRKIYSTGAPILKWYTVWARTDEAESRVGMFLVPAGLPGTRIIETWDHLGLRASGSHDVIFDDVVFPLDHEIDVRLPDEWRTPDATQTTVHAIFIAAIYDGVIGWSAFSGTASRPTSARRWRVCRGRRKCSAASRRGYR